MLQCVYCLSRFRETASKADSRGDRWSRPRFVVSLDGNLLCRESGSAASILRCVQGECEPDAADGCGAPLGLPQISPRRLDEACAARHNESLARWPLHVDAERSGGGNNSHSVCFRGWRRCRSRRPLVWPACRQRGPVRKMAAVRRLAEKAVDAAEARAGVLAHAARLPETSGMRKHCENLRFGRGTAPFGPARKSCWPQRRKGPSGCQKRKRAGLTPGSWAWEEHKWGSDVAANRASDNARQNAKRARRH